MGDLIHWGKDSEVERRRGGGKGRSIPSVGGNLTEKENRRRGDSLLTALSKKVSVRVKLSGIRKEGGV